jgi:L-ascorbate metabolism protein UlaG (beta-lactamase superfamily)
MINVMRRVRASVILPMHWFTDRTLERFLQGMEAEGFAMERARTNEVEVSLRALPERPTVIALRPAWLRDTE